MLRFRYGMVYHGLREKRRQYRREKRAYALRGAVYRARPCETFYRGGIVRPPRNLHEITKTDEFSSAFDVLIHSIVCLFGFLCFFSAFLFVSFDAFSLFFFFGFDIRRKKYRRADRPEYARHDGFPEFLVFQVAIGA